MLLVCIFYLTQMTPPNMPHPIRKLTRLSEQLSKLTLSRRKTGSERGAARKKMFFDKRTRGG